MQMVRRVFQAPYLPARNQVMVCNRYLLNRARLFLIRAEPGITVLELEGRVIYHLNILKLEVLGMDIPFVVSILPLSRLVPMWSSVFRVTIHWRSPSMVISQSVLILI